MGRYSTPCRTPSRARSVAGHKRGYPTPGSSGRRNRFKRRRTGHAAVARATTSGRSSFSYSGLASRMALNAAKSWAKSRTHGGGNQSNGNVHGVFERASTKINLGHGGKHIKGSGSFKYFDEFYGIITSNEGTQGIGNIGRVAFYGDIIDGGVTGSNQPATQPVPSQFATKQGMFALNPYQKITGGEYYTAGVTSLSDYINLENVNMHYMFSNFSTSPAILDLFVLQYKTNAAKLPTQAWIEGLKQQGVTPDSAAAADQASSTIGVYGGPTQGWPTPNLLGQHPKSCAPFNKEFKVLAEKTFDFSADSNIAWNLNINFKKRLDKQFLNETSTPSEGTVDKSMNYKNLTIVIMYRIRGNVIADTRLLSGRQPSVSTTELGYVCSRSYTCTPAPGNRLKTQTAVPYLLGGASVTDELFTNVVDASAAVINLI